jgi:hypothetical protein
MSTIGAGRPVLATGQIDGDLAVTLRQSGLPCRIARPDDAKAIRDAITELVCGVANGTLPAVCDEARRRFARETLAGELATVLDGLRGAESMKALMTRLRRGEGPFWSRMKWAIKQSFYFHLPVFWLTRPVFAWLYLLHVSVGRVFGGLLRFFWYEPTLRSQCERVGVAFHDGTSAPSRW